MAQVIAENRADYKCRTHLAMTAELEIVRDCDRGSPAIKAKGIVYLPKWPGERQSVYNLRLARSVYFNTYRKIKNGLIGMVVKTNPILGDDIPPEVKAHLENIDLAGTHIDVFVKDVLDKALEGHCHIFVDMEKPLPPGSTVKQAELKNRRPFWLLYAKDQAINFIPGRINGEEVLTQITFAECCTMRVGRYGEAEIMQYRTLTLPVTAENERGEPVAYGPMTWELQRFNPKTNELDVVDGGETKLDRIPVVTIYTNKRGFMLSDPYLLELAKLNIAHYQKWSDLDTQEKALVPVLVHKEVEDSAGGKIPPKDKKPQNEQRQIGPNVVFRLTGKDDSLTWESADSKGADSARQSLQDIEQRMSALGLSIIAPKDKVAVTATDKILDQGERHGELSTIARAVQDGVETCLAIHARYIGKADANGDGGSITITVDTSDTSAVTAITAPKATMPQPDAMPTPAPGSTAVQ